ncbi:hypothetical protein B296_00052433, partial [Ensete ventricosum]
VNSMHRVDAVGNSSGVHREFTEGIRSLPGWRKGVHQKRTETYQKIVGGSRKAYRELEWSYDGPRSSLSIGSGFGRCSGILSEFARGFIEGIRKLARNMSEDYRKKTDDLPQECQRLPDWRKLGLSLSLWSLSSTESEERVSSSGAVGVEPWGWLTDCAVVMLGVPDLTSSGGVASYQEESAWLSSILVHMLIGIGREEAGKLKKGRLGLLGNAPRLGLLGSTPQDASDFSSG